MSQKVQPMKLNNAKHANNVARSLVYLGRPREPPLPSVSCGLLYVSRKLPKDHDPQDIRVLGTLAQLTVGSGDSCKLSG